MTTWRVAAMSAAGTSHLASGVPCQDKFQFCREALPGGEGLFIACSDGAGSACRSEDGARWACDEAMLFLREALARGGPDALDERSMLDAVAKARDAVLRNARDDGADPREFASTLLIVVATEREVRLAQLGDGVVVVGNDDDRRIAVQVEQEMLNVTDFLVDANALDKVHHWHAPAELVDEIAVSTDGLIPVLIDQRQREPHSPMFKTFFAALRSAADETEVSERLKTFMQSDQVCQRTDDDKTLVLAQRRKDR
jgi:hypothetical protein